MYWIHPFLSLCTYAAMFSRPIQRTEKSYLNHHKMYISRRVLRSYAGYIEVPPSHAPSLESGRPRTVLWRWKYMVGSSDGRDHILGRTDAADSTQDPVISEQYSPCSETKHRSLRSLWSEEKCNRFDATTIFVNDKTA